MANYAEIGMVDKLETGFQQVPLVQIFLKFSQYCHKISIIKNQQRNLTNIFSNKNFKQSLYCGKCFGQSISGHKFNYRVII